MRASVEGRKERRKEAGRLDRHTFLDATTAQENALHVVSPVLNRQGLFASEKEII